MKSVVDAIREVSDEMGRLTAENVRLLAEADRLRDVVAAQAATIARLGRVAEAAREPACVERLRHIREWDEAGYRWEPDGPINRLLSAIDGAGAAGGQEASRPVAPGILTLEEARKTRRCRICGGPDTAPLVLDYGEEYAHERCLDDAGAAGEG